MNAVAVEAAITPQCVGVVNKRTTPARKRIVTANPEDKAERELCLFHLCKPEMWLVSSRKR